MWLNTTMSSVQKERYHQQEQTLQQKRVDVTDLVKRVKIEQGKERKNNLILSCAAISAFTVLGIILTL